MPSQVPGQLHMATLSGRHWKACVWAHWDDDNHALWRWEGCHAVCLCNCNSSYDPFKTLHWFQYGTNLVIYDINTFFEWVFFHVTHFNLFIRANTSARGAFMCFCKRPKIIFLFFSYIGHGGAEKHSKYQISLSLWRVCNVMRFQNIPCNASRVGVSCWLRRLVCQELCVWGYFWFSYDTLCCGLRASLCQGLKIHQMVDSFLNPPLCTYYVLLAVNGHGSVSSHPSWKTFLINPKGLSWQFV